MKDISGLISVMNQEFVGAVKISNQTDLKRFDEMMTAVESGAGSTMPSGHRDFYTDTIGEMIVQMRDACIARLSDDYVHCTPPSAAALCDGYIVYPTQARYLDLDLGSEYQRPAAYNTEVVHEGGGGWCYYYYDWEGESDSLTAVDSDTEGQGTAESSSGPSTTGVGETSGSDETSGVDESSGGAGASAPFGDLEALVHCNTAHTSCTYDPQLIDNVYAALEQVTLDDAAVLRFLLPSDPDFPGIRLEGFDDGEPSTDLAAAAGLENGDIIRAVDGIKLDSAAVLLDTFQKLVESPAATLTYSRGTFVRDVRIEPR